MTAVAIYVTVRAAERLEEFTANLKAPILVFVRTGASGDQSGSRLPAARTAVRDRRPRRRRRMLRITRRAGERIVLGDDVIVEVMEIRGQTVRHRDRCPSLGAGLPRGDLARGQARERGSGPCREPRAARGRVAGGGLGAGGLAGLTVFGGLARVGGCVVGLRGGSARWACAVGPHFGPAPPRTSA